MEEKMITITVKEYERLLDSELMLQALEDAGVDNWHGYGDAMETVEEWKKEAETSSANKAR